MKRTWGTRFIPLIAVMLVLAGCVSLAAVERHYSSVVLDDGVSRREAVWIAAKGLKDLGESRNFDIGSGRVVAGESTKCLTGHWLVVFNRAQFMNIFEVYYFVVDRKTGEIVRSGSTWLYAKPGMVAVVVSKLDNCY